MFRTFLIALFIATSLPAYAGDFPGIGDPGAWSDALPYYNRGNRYLNQGRYEDAVRDFQVAVDKYPHDADFLINLGVALRKVEDYKGAEQAFKSAIKLKPKDWMAWSNLGNAYLKQDRMKDTISAFEQAMKCNPPASERAAMVQDIADIHKILRATGQEPLPTPPGQKVAAKPKAKTTAAKTSAKPASVHGSAPAPGIPAPSTPKQTKEWGYD